ncbi:hypothetical protein HWV62_39335 [Athelia sp. TMB]|nr:hypothetical protein HWV62_39335 [Athelia sp. TMB]
MPHADRFDVSSDVEPVDEDDIPSQIRSTPASTLSNINMLASTAAGVSNAMSPSLPSTPTQPEINSSRAVLGRRARDENTEPWSGREKVRISEFVKRTCMELGVPLGEQEEIQKYSQLSTHQLVIFHLCKDRSEKHDSQDIKMNIFIKSPEFKEYVAEKLKLMLLDAKLSSYKTGMLERVMRHMRLCANHYHIPPELRATVSSKAFVAAVSSVLVNARASYKAKLKAAWIAQKTIYAIVKDLSGDHSHEFSDDIWGRWAWIHFKLADFVDVAANTETKWADKDFWDWLDAELGEIRDKYADHEPPLAPAEQARKISKIFARALEEHTKKFPAVKKPMSRALPAWQEDLSRAVIEMESYSQGELGEAAQGEDSDEE